MLTFPVTAWVLFAAVMWGTHFSGLFDVALEVPLVHDLEHGLFLVSALLFWWPAVGADPAPWRLAHPARIGYVFLQMTQNTFLAFVLLNVTTVLYPHYATLGQPYGIDPLADQRLAAGVMWIAGDLIFLSAIMALVAGWMRSESARGRPRGPPGRPGPGTDPGPRAPPGRTTRRPARRAAPAVGFRVGVELSG